MTWLLYLMIGAALGFGAASVRTQMRVAATAAMLDRVCGTDEDISEVVIDTTVERILARHGETTLEGSGDDYARLCDEPCGLPIDMGRIIAIESSGNSQVPDSPKGCRGLCQIAEATWDDVTEEMDVTWDWATDAFDPGCNRAVGHHYINKTIPRMLKFYGIDDNVATRIGAYNWGIGRVLGVWAEYGGDWLAHAPAETQDYVIKYSTMKTTR